MYFKDKNSFNYFLKTFKGKKSGSQGICYFDTYNNKIYKVMHQYFEDDLCPYEYINYDKNEFIKFKDIKNNTYVFPYENIIVSDKVVGYVTDLVNNATELYLINPLEINLTTFNKQLLKVDKDTITISKANIVTYDVLYNILYTGKDIKIIDTLEYTFKNDSFYNIYNANSSTTSYAFKSFLVDGYFDSFINNNKLLKELYEEGSCLEFLKEFKKQLEEYEQKHIYKLAMAKNSRDKFPIRKKIPIRKIYK